MKPVVALLVFASAVLWPIALLSQTYPSTENYPAAAFSEVGQGRWQPSVYHTPNIQQQATVGEVYAAPSHGATSHAAISQTAYQYYQYENYAYQPPKRTASPSPSDVPLPAAEQAPAQSPELTQYNWCEKCGQAGCDGCRRWRWLQPICGECCLGDPWTLPQPWLLSRSGIVVGGWLTGGIMANAYGDASNGPLSLNSLGDGFNAHQLWIYGQRKADTGGQGFDWGFRVDYMFGVDGPDTQAFGDQSWDYNWNSSRDYGSAIPQLYAEIAINNWTLKGGRFYTPMGYEVVPAPNNFFYSHSYAFGYGEPFTHTGVVLDYRFGPRLSVFGGWVNGWDTGWDNKNHASLFLGGANLGLGERATLAWVICTGYWGNGTVGPNVGEIMLNTLTFTWRITERWTYVLQNDIGTNWALPNAGDAQWYGIDQYLMYKINDCWALGMRVEWFRDDDGRRVIAGNAGNYYNLTFGFNYKPHANFTFRPELRYDWYDGSIGASRPFNGGLERDQLSGGFDLIFTF